MINAFMRESSTRRFNWGSWNCVHFVVAWASLVHRKHADTFNAWRTSFPTFDQIRTERDAQRFWVKRGIRSHYDFAEHLAAAANLKPVAHARPGVIVVRDGMKCGVVDTDMRTLFLNSRTGLAHDHSYNPEDQFLAPEGL